MNKNEIRIPHPKPYHSGQGKMFLCWVERYMVLLKLGMVIMPILAQGYTYLILLLNYSIVSYPWLRTWYMWGLPFPILLAIIHIFRYWLLAPNKSTNYQTKSFPNNPKIIVKCLWKKWSKWYRRTRSYGFEP